jgi:hypothetical protein
MMIRFDKSFKKYESSRPFCAKSTKILDSDNAIIIARAPTLNPSKLGIIDIASFGASSAYEIEANDRISDT